MPTYPGKIGDVQDRGLSGGVGWLSGGNVGQLGRVNMLSEAVCFESLEAVQLRSTAHHRRTPQLVARFLKRNSQTGCIWRRVANLVPAVGDFSA
jgi:hypothetical protein